MRSLRKSSNCTQTLRSEHRQRLEAAKLDIHNGRSEGPRSIRGGTQTSTGNTCTKEIRQDKIVRGGSQLSAFSREFC